MTKEAIAITTATVLECDFSTWVHICAARKLGLGDEGILELMTVVDLFTGLNKLMAGLQVVTDEKSWYG
jgi:alkylhydroperoxidase/carboxymuconolactone decarboxylase family protein YurZ